MGNRYRVRADFDVVVPMGNEQAATQVGEAHLHDIVTQLEGRGDRVETGGASLATLAKRHSGVTVIANGNLDDPETAVSLLQDGAADVVALGKAALATRDWPHRVRNNEAFDELDGSLFAPVADVKDWELELPA